MNISSGPLEYIPSFVRRKMVKKKSYDLDACEVFRRNLRNYRLPRAGDALSQSLAGFTKGKPTFYVKSNG
jgi:hypothetical protein